MLIKDKKRKEILNIIFSIELNHSKKMYPENCTALEKIKNELIQNSLIQKDEFLNEKEIECLVDYIKNFKLAWYESTSPGLTPIEKFFNISKKDIQIFSQLLKMSFKGSELIYYITQCQTLLKTIEKNYDQDLIKEFAELLCRSNYNSEETQFLLLLYKHYSIAPFLLGVLSLSSNPKKCDFYRLLERLFTDRLGPSLYVELRLLMGKFNANTFKHHQYVPVISQLLLDTIYNKNNFVISDINHSQNRLSCAPLAQNLAMSPVEDCQKILDALSSYYEKNHYINTGYLLNLLHENPKQEYYAGVEQLSTPGSNRKKIKISFTMFRHCGWVYDELKSYYLGRNSTDLEFHSESRSAYIIIERYSMMKLISLLANIPSKTIIELYKNGCFESDRSEVLKDFPELQTPEKNEPEKPLETPSSDKEPKKEPSSTIEEKKNPECGPKTLKFFLERQSEDSKKIKALEEQIAELKKEPTTEFFKLSTKDFQKEAKGIVDIQKKNRAENSTRDRSHSI